MQLTFIKPSLISQNFLLWFLVIYRKCIVRCLEKEHVLSLSKYWFCHRLAVKTLSHRQDTVSLPVPSQSCRVDNQTLDCDDNNSCTEDVCNGSTGICSNTFVSNCCGNGVCEIGELPGCEDCGPFSISTPPGTAYSGPYSFMFDVQAIQDIEISSISFQTFNSGTVSIFAAARSYSGIETDSSSWVQVFTGATTALSSCEFVSLVDFLTKQKIRDLIRLFNRQSRLD